MQRKRAFTLIELLIVVAIIAILAAIAIPNLLSAQTRAKVSRVASDQRAMSLGIESYMTDFNTYPLRQTFWDSGYTYDRFPPGYRVLTTPIAYMGTSPEAFYDPFAILDKQGESRIGNLGSNPLYYEYIPYGANGMRSRLKNKYIIESFGPDSIDSIHSSQFWNRDANGPPNIDNALIGFRAYDPSNGVISNGDLYRIGGIGPTWFQERGYSYVIPNGN